jgi:phosphatidate cytidylyltransferase
MLEQKYLIYLFLVFLIIAILVWVLAKNQYVKEKSLWWIYIILFFIFLLLHQYSLIFALIVLSTLASFEFFRNLFRKWFTNCERAIFSILFVVLLVWFDYFVYKNTSLFVILFIIISLSDIIAYFVWRWFPWKKGFTKLSPNKTLSWVIAQILFVFVVLYFLNTCLILKIWQILLISVFTTWWDLIESYFKRKTWEKDMGYYIPWHGGVLDRIDSSFVSLGILGIISLYFLIF